MKISPTGDNRSTSRTQRAPRSERAPRPERGWRRQLPAVALAASLAGTTAGTLSVAALSAGTASASAINLSQVTLNIGDQAGAGSQALLKAAGLLNKLPFKAKWADFTSGPPMLEAESAGSVDVGAVGDSPPVFAASGGAAIDIVESFSSGPNATAIVVPKGSPITSVGQLKGKTVAVAQGSSSNYHLLTVLEKAHLTIKDITPEYLQPADALAALTSGKVAAWDVWSPYIEEAVGLDGARVLVNNKGYGSPYSFEVASKAALANPDKQAAIAAYLKIVNKAYAWEKTHTAAWAKTWAASTGISLKVMETATKDAITTPGKITPATITSEQGLVDAFYGAGLIPKKFNFKNYSYTGYNNSLFSN